MAVLVDGPQGRQNLGGASPLTPGRSRGLDNAQSERDNISMVTETTQIGPMRCPQCKTSGYYFRQADQVYVCKKCGTIWPAPPIVVMG